MDLDHADAGSVQDGRQTVSFGPFQFDRRGLLLSTKGSPLSIQPKSLLVLRCLVDRPGEVVFKQELMDLVWGDAVVTENSLVEAIRMLRLAIGDDPRTPTYIETVHRRGYRFIATVSENREPPGDAAPYDSAETDPTSPTLDCCAVADCREPRRRGSWSRAPWRQGRRGPRGDVSQLTMMFDDVPMRLNRNLFNMTISPDGRSVAYGGTAQGKLYVRHLDRLEAQPIAGSDFSGGADLPPRLVPLSISVTRR